MDTAHIIFLGTGGAWGVPELNCDCLICKKMRESGEKRERTSLLFSGRTKLLIDCGPDIRSQLTRNRVKSIDGVLISHEHGDHYMGMDDLFAYRRNAPRNTWRPIPVYVTPESWEVISLRFSYLEQMDVIKIHLIEPGKWLTHEEFEILPFKTEHGAFAKGSVGFLIRSKARNGKSASVVYTSDFMDLPEVPREILEPDYLIMQSFWLNEPVNNRPHHMSFQRAIKFIELFKPGKETYLVHLGDADAVPGDPANKYLKKYEPKDPLRSPSGGGPYPIPLNHEQWQNTVDQIVSDLAMPYKVTVGHDGMHVFT